VTVKRFAKIVIVGLIGLTVAVLSQTSVAKGHGGGLDSDGGHNCYVGSCAGTYHCHRSWGPRCGGGASYQSPNVALPAYCVSLSTSLGLTRSEVALIQLKLLVNGFNPGPIDGIFGSRTHSALRAYERYEGLRLSPRGSIYFTTVYAMDIDC
jgi:hypothetical protein